MGIENIDVWQRGMLLIQSIYDISSRFPREEKYILVSQLRRAVISIPSNIAEGHARKGRREYARFASHAQGSTAEVFTQIRIALNLGYVSQSEAARTFEELDHLARGLNRLRTSLLRPKRISNLESRAND